MNRDTKKLMKNRNAKILQMLQENEGKYKTISGIEKRSDIFLVILNTSNEEEKIYTIDDKGSYKSVDYYLDYGIQEGIIINTPFTVDVPIKRSSITKDIILFNKYNKTHKVKDYILI